MSLPLSINKGVVGDLHDILEYYEKESGTSPANTFYQELLTRINLAQKNPRYFPFSTGDRRRVNLDGFPYHFLYRIKPTCIRILVLKHHQRNPNYGTRRQ
jgi:plasmid stabilization system protein ParE